jgi:hypothetical protein
MISSAIHGDQEKAHGFTRVEANITVMAMEKEM